MFVKICGVTRVEDAEAAVEAGADAIGFVFWPKSPRFVDPFRARAIAAALPPFVTIVGLFVNQPADYINGVAALVRLGAVQLHGDELPADAAPLRRPIVKAIDWNAAAAIAAQRRTILAGGLTPENVADAIRRVRPFGVDVSSGVEQAPGIKDRAKIRALFESIDAQRS